MQARYHIVAGGIVSASLIPVLGVNSAAFFAASVLIDVDHYVDYVCRNKFTDFSIRRMFTYVDQLGIHTGKRRWVSLSVMHTGEFLLLVFTIAALTNLALFEAILWGLIFHIVSDLIYFYYRGVFFRRALSIIEYVLRWNRLKQKGLNPELPHRLALEAALRGSESPDRGI
jgi:hypothetical protein